jgi:hypothetical protein
VQGIFSGPIGLLNDLTGAGVAFSLDLGATGSLAGKLRIVDASGHTVGAEAPGIILGSPPTKKPRSDKWPAFKRRFLRANPTCIVTGEPATEVHHYIEFDTRPDLELVEGNCRPVRDHEVHWYFAHAAVDWSVANPDLDECAAVMRKAIEKMRRAKA